MESAAPFDMSSEMENVLEWPYSEENYADSTDVPTLSHGAQSSVETGARDRHSTPAPNIFIRPSDLSVPRPAEADQQTDQSPRFLQQVNTRLRDSNNHLQDEVDALRRQQSEMQERVNRVRSRLRPLEGSLQELLDHPRIRSAGEEVSTRLFAILDRIIEMNMTLSSAPRRE